MSADQFAALVETGVNRIPVSRTLLADTETPLSTYNKLAKGPRSFLFESVQGGERWGRYSIIGLTARTWLAVSGHTLRVYRDEQVVEERAVDDPLAEIEAIRDRYHSAEVPELPVFHGGWVGYFAYDTVRFVEPRLADTCPPDERLDDLEAQLASPGPPLESVSLSPCDTSTVEATAQHATDQATFEGWVERIKEYILAGDVMQVVPSQRMTLPFKPAPLTLYRALRHLNPSPYLYFIDLGDTILEKTELLRDTGSQEYSLFN
ncbi:MAG: anthranilate synthase component I, partial [Gammaproteobacteria bacterium]|nr:anthranilate synthase component I [Gammaproteobacteria bacterium]